MTDNTNDKPQGGDAVLPQGGNDGQSQGESKTHSVADLMAKIDALEKDNAGYRRKQRENETAAQKEKERQLAENQQWKELAESRGAELQTLKPIAEQHEAITAAFNASLDNRLKQIPEDVRKRTVDPIRAALSPVEFSNWLDANLDILRARQAPGLDGGAGTTAARNGHTATLTAEETMMADAMGISHAAYAKRKAEVAALRGTRDEPITRTTQE
jgi:hypothetical protein